MFIPNLAQKPAAKGQPAIRCDELSTANEQTSHTLSSTQCFLSSTQGLRLAFVSRLSTVAAAELVQLMGLLDGVVLTNTPDVRVCPWEDRLHKLSSSSVYRAVVSNGEGCEYYKFIWENCAPPKVKFFGWLLVHNRANFVEIYLSNYTITSKSPFMCK
jgi:hypothetical protein